MKRMDFYLYAAVYGKLPHCEYNCKQKSDYSPDAKGARKVKRCVEFFLNIISIPNRFFYIFNDVIYYWHQYEGEKC